jgi:hypothetical protein
MMISHFATAAILIAMGLDAAALPQVEKMRKEKVNLSDGKCMQSNIRSRGKYSFANVEFGLISRIPTRLPVRNSLNPECRPRGDKPPDRELKLLVRPRALARIRTT